MNLFAYGTLMFPEIMALVAGAHFDSVAAELKGYQRLRVHSKPFPGIIPCDSFVIAGRLYPQLDATALARVDFFEDDFYERVKVQVLLQNGESVTAYTYVVCESQRHVLTEEAWDADTFAATQFPIYLERAKRWMSQMPTLA